MKILLDYFFPISSIEPTPQASTAFLKQVALVVKPKSGVDPGLITLTTSQSQVAALTDNTEATQLFAGGLARVFIITADDLDLEDILEGHESDFYTLLISSDFDEDNITVASATGTATITSYANLTATTPDTLTIAGITLTAQAGAATPGSAFFQAATSNDATALSLAAQINAHATLNDSVTATALGAVVTITANSTGLAGNDIAVVYVDNSSAGLTLGGLSGGKLAGGDGLFVGAYDGVVGVSSDDDTFNAAQAVMRHRVAFHTTSANKAKNMAFSFGKMLSNALNWRNQQYITMPFADDVATLGEAQTLFDDKISFVISDDEFSNRLALFATGGKAIVAPYIIRNLEVDLQSRALSYISGNQPAYTLKQAALIEDELKKVVQSYIDREWIEKGEVQIKLENDNFVASGYINVAEPGALWRIFGEMRQTL